MTTFANHTSTDRNGEVLEHVECAECDDLFIRRQGSTLYLCPDCDREDYMLAFYDNATFNGRPV